MLLQAMQVFMILKFYIFLTLNYNLRILNLPLKGFKFVTTIVLAFKKIKSEDKKSMTLFIHTQKKKHLSIKVTLMMCLINLYYNYIKHVYQTYQAY